ncbi:DinB family protein [Frigoriflavimonas asaccharolytica]|uniref:Putative damage-inducible protein DinB n=1 Tax=Frigoriflavimonas asaccharolytica TaxID=2735899 RepID=A0A8J8G9Q0_9FLAO|nr:DinB family protein [Frigoriflavimonas asaccharolytica]NRS93230.1 putative damage-inducible protein DinB [Frigoriflavimonas asaccharolytica]
MTEFQKYIQRYVDLLPSENWMQQLIHSENQTLEIYSKLDDESSLFKYAEGKWSLKEILQHLIDCERIFQFRALSFSRGESHNLPGFDEEIYANNANADSRKLQDLIDEFTVVRQSSLLLFKSFSKEMLANNGFANDNEISVETIGKLVVGHNLHHLNVIIDKYLKLN